MLKCWEYPMRALRFHSFGLSKVFAEKSAPAIHLQVVTLEDIPLYNEDLDNETGFPGIAALKRMIFACDGILISTPEYNHGIPAYTREAGLTFMLQWLGRLRDAVLSRRVVAV